MLQERRRESWLAIPLEAANGLHKRLPGQKAINIKRDTKQQAKTDATVDHSRPTDGALVAACLNGDAAAWEELIHRYERLIYSIPIRKGFSTVDAADVFQSVCVLLLEKLPTLRDHGKIASWLITTTTRESWRVAALWRREGPRQTREPDDGQDELLEIQSLEPLADEESALIERQHILREAVEALPDRCRLLITLLFYDKDDPSYTDIARRLKMPVASVGPTRARCLEKLRKVLEGKI
jgi:RNA polymerase sigma factor (sigma-70 family)